MAARRELPLRELLEKRVDGALEDLLEIAVGNGVPKQRLRGGDLVAQLARGGELNFEAILRKRCNGRARWRARRRRRLELRCGRRLRRAGRRCKQRRRGCARELSNLLRRIRLRRDRGDELLDLA